MSFNFGGSARNTTNLIPLREKEPICSDDSAFNYQVSPLRGRDRLGACPQVGRGAAPVMVRNRPYKFTALSCLFRSSRNKLLSPASGESWRGGTQVKYISSPYDFILDMNLFLFYLRSICPRRGFRSRR